MNQMAPAGEPTCPRCGSSVAASRFCRSCGYALALLSPGQILDEKYEVMDKIGEGGMGEVYRVRHVHLDEIRIVKVTKSDSAGGQPACSATVFTDVACPGARFVNFTNQLAAEGITDGCDGGMYCPGNPNTRGQMAVFLVKTFGLQLYAP